MDSYNILQKYRPWTVFTIP